MMIFVQISNQRKLFQEERNELSSHDAIWVEMNVMDGLKREGHDVDIVEI